MADQSGNSMHAEVNGDYINVSVGLGRWPARVSGILANAASGNVSQIEARTGALYSPDCAFNDLYREYADSWRVPPEESLLSVCGEREEIGIPEIPFYANNLEPQVYQRARAVCTAAGVKVKSLLDACTLDVAVIGNETAAKVFVGLRAPARVGQVVASHDDRDRDHDRDHDRPR